MRHREREREGNKKWWHQKFIETDRLQFAWKWNSDNKCRYEPIEMFYFNFKMQLLKFSAILEFFFIFSLKFQISSKWSPFISSDFNAIIWQVKLLCWEEEMKMALKNSSLSGCTEQKLRMKIQRSEMKNDKIHHKY